VRQARQAHSCRVMFVAFLLIALPQCSNYHALLCVFSPRKLTACYIILTDATNEDRSSPSLLLLGSSSVEVELKKDAYERCALSDLSTCDRYLEQGLIMRFEGWSVHVCEKIAQKSI